MARENSSRKGRIKRYAKVGASLSKVAAKRYLGKKDDALQARRLKEALGGLKGPLMKIAQIMGTVPDMIPDDYMQELRQLQSGAPPMGWPFVRRRMETELGKDWQKNFAHFDQNASAAASLGQVHKAETKSGQIVACKLQYPEMQSAVDADLNQLKLILGLYRRFSGAIDTKELHREIAERLREELDYEREAKHIALYRDMLKDETTVHIPQTLPKLSTKRLLTMGWLEGKPILDFKSAPQKTRNQIALNMFRAWYAPFYHYGVIHGDPHLGNYSVRDDLSINLLDFGCIRVFQPAFVQGVIDLYFALSDNKPELAVKAYESWGFEKPGKKLIEILNLWAGFLYGPLMKKGPSKLADGHSGAYGKEIAAKVHAELKKIGGVKPPREFVFMDRAAVGLGSVFLHLSAEIDWHELFHKLIEGFNIQDMEKRQKKILHYAGLL